MVQLKSKIVRSLYQAAEHFNETDTHGIESVSEDLSSSLYNYLSLVRCAGRNHLLNYFSFRLILASSAEERAIFEQALADMIKSGHTSNLKFLGWREFRFLQTGQKTKDALYDSSNLECCINVLASQPVVARDLFHADCIRLTACGDLNKGNSKSISLQDIGELYEHTLLKTPMSRLAAISFFPEFSSCDATKDRDVIYEIRNRLLEIPADYMLSKDLSHSQKTEAINSSVDHIFEAIAEEIADAATNACPK